MQSDRRNRRQILSQLVAIDGRRRAELVIIDLLIKRELALQPFACAGIARVEKTAPIGSPGDIPARRGFADALDRLIVDGSPIGRAEDSQGPAFRAARGKRYGHQLTILGRHVPIYGRVSAWIELHRIQNDSGRARSIGIREPDQ
jgi:hypothetical protein